MFTMIFVITAFAFAGFIFSVVVSAVSNSGCGVMGYVDHHGHCTFE